MATTTEIYNLQVTITEAGVSPFMVGDAIKRAMATMPDDTMDWSFDPFQGAEDEVRLDLEFESRQFGTLVITPSVSTEVLSQESRFEQQILGEGR